MGEKKITYLLGAGASASVIPIVSEMPAKIDETARVFESAANDRADPKPNLQEIANDLKWLFEQSEQHHSIDTAAKKFFILGDNAQLQRLKKALSIFLLFCQNQKGLDKRYDKFWASILKPTRNERIVPDNISILTWNYDYQLIRSFNNFVKDRKHALQTLAAPRDFLNSDKNDFFISHLNGIAGGYSKENKDLFYWEMLRETDRLKLFDVALNFYHEMNNPVANFSIKFAWEYSDYSEEKFEKKYLNKIVANLKTTQILIVIGYSFPNFNQEIDRLLIRSMKEKLEKVYVQVPDNDFEERKFKLRDYFDIKMKTYNVPNPSMTGGAEWRNLLKVDEETIFQVKGVNEFFIPPEF